MPTRRPAPVRSTAAGPAVRHPLRRTLSRVGTAIAAVVTLVTLGTGVAFAHVTVNPGEAASGSYAKLTFRVPTESDTASTVGLTVTLPLDHPLPSVSLMPVPGWTATTTKATLNPPVTEGRFTLTEATASVTWRTTGDAGIKPGEFQEFSLSVGPIPEVSSLVFPAKQTYSDGSIVEWKDIAAAGVDPHSLDHPAPLLTVTPAATDDVAAQTAASTGVPLAAAGEASSLTISASDTTAQILGGAALLVAAIALLVAVVGWRRGRGAPQGPAESRETTEERV